MIVLVIIFVLVMTGRILAVAWTIRVMARWYCFAAADHETHTDK